MIFNWRPIDYMSFNVARQCDTSVGRLLIKPGRPMTRKYVVRVAGRVVSRFETSMSSAVMRAEAEARKRAARAADLEPEMAYMPSARR